MQVFGCIRIDGCSCSEPIATNHIRTQHHGATTNAATTATTTMTTTKNADNYIPIRLTTSSTTSTIDSSRFLWVCLFNRLGMLKGFGLQRSFKDLDVVVVQPLK